MNKQEYIKTLQNQIGLNNLYLEQCRKDNDEFGERNFREEGARLKVLLEDAEAAPENQEFPS